MSRLIHSFGRGLRTALILLPPAAAATLFVIDRYVTPLPATWGSFLGFAGLIATLYALLLLGILLWHRDRYLRFRDGFNRKSAHAEEQDRLLRDMRGRIEVLTAEREIGLILNEPLAPDAMINRVLSLTGDALSTGERDRIGIYLRNGGDAPNLVALREGSTIRRLATPVPAQNEPMLRRGTPAFSAEENRIQVAVPLSHDRENIGMMKLDLSLSGAESRRRERVQFVQDNVPELARFVSLALKTKDLYLKATEDALTGLATRRHFNSQLDLLFSMARRHDDPLSLIMVDIDHFKKVNDRYGHPAGDAVLKGVAAILGRHARRAGDTTSGGYRYGGEEMSILLPRTDLAGAKLIAERIRKAVRAKPFRQNGRAIRVTVSLGAAQVAEEMEAPTALVEAADHALYKAKESGRDRTVC